MTNVDPTRSRPRSTAADDEGLDDVAAGRSVACDACLAGRGECDFHRGWADGWEACAAFVAHQVQHADDAALDGGVL